MPKSCFDGYLTEGCATCPVWADGSDARGIGCACHFPIGECPHFAKIMKEDEKNEHKALVERLRQYSTQARENHDDTMAEDLLWASILVEKLICEEA